MIDLEDSGSVTKSIIIWHASSTMMVTHLSDGASAPVDRVDATMIQVMEVRKINGLVLAYRALIRYKGIRARGQSENPTKRQEGESKPWVWPLGLAACRELFERPSRRSVVWGVAWRPSNRIERLGHAFSTENHPGSDDSMPEA